MTIYRKVSQYASLLTNYCQYKKYKTNESISDNMSVPPSNHLPDKSKGYIAAKEFKKKYPNAYKKLGE